SMAAPGGDPPVVRMKAQPDGICQSQNRVREHFAIFHAPRLHDSARIEAGHPTSIRAEAGGANRVLVTQHVAQMAAAGFPDEHLLPFRSSEDLPSSGAE